MISMFFSATADPTGWPPNVSPWSNISPSASSGAATRSCISTPPSAKYAEVSPLANVSRSGTTSNRCDPNHSPRRPQAQITSSAQSRIP